jgi:LacI family transcriptional regulator
VTISDVARKVGVATSTVSRALSNPDRVNEVTRKRILEAASELSYRPNPQARSLTSGRTSSIALLIPDVTNPFFFDLIKGAQRQARAREYRLLLLDTEESAEVEAAQLAEASTYADGVILAASRSSDRDLAEASKLIPIVVINRDVPKLPSVVIDTGMAMTQAMHHLASLGHRSIAYLGGPSTSWSSRRRWRAIQRAAAQLGVECHQVGPFSPTVQAGVAAADAAVHLGVTASVFFNDLMAIGALQRFAERGIVVPRDMSVVGCDDIFGADFCDPPLTTLTAPIQRAGEVATDMLLAQFQNFGVEAPASRLRESLPTFLTIRSSTGPVPVGERLARESAAPAASKDAKRVAVP